MKLSENDKKQLMKLRDQFIAAMKKRERNLAGFDMAIEFLIDLEKITTEFSNITIPYKEASLKIDEDLSHVGRNIFNLLKLKHSFNAANKLLKEIRDILFDKTVLNCFKEQIANEPRIISLHYDFEANKKNVTKSKGMFAQTEMTETLIKNYKIGFSDGSILTMHDLNNEIEMKNALEVFNDKMEELTLRQIYVKH